MATAGITEAMMDRSPREQALLAQGRVIALVVAFAMLGWMGVQWLGGQMGWPTKYILLADLSAAAAFFWSVVAAWRLMQRLKE